MIARLTIMAGLALMAQPAIAQSNDHTEAPEPAIPEPVSFTTEHNGVFNGTNIEYRAEAGELYLTDDAGKPTAAFFHIAYLRSDVDDPASRPVTFVFNGGPGSASVWLHMGAFGPRRVVVPSDAERDDGAAPYRVEANPASPLDVTDLVMVDPVGTGYSRALGDKENTDFWTFNADTASVVQFIRRWITRHQRWNSPKFIAGESFGTTRGVAVAEQLMSGGQDLALNGLILISQALDYTGSTPVHDNLIAYLTYLPSMAAVAHIHGRATSGDSLARLIEDVRRFTIEDYAPALLKGQLLEDAERRRIAERLSQYTGLGIDYILRSDLRVPVTRFIKELRRDEGLVLGRLDGRYRADEPDDIDDTPTIGDAASYSISSAYTAAINDHLSRFLGVSMDRPYLTSNSAINENWVWRPVPKGAFWEPAYVNVARRLAATMTMNTDMRVLVANGYYDLITPFFDAEYTFARHGIPADRVEMTYYEAGHMMYVHEPSLEKLMADVHRFIGAQARSD